MAAIAQAAGVSLKTVYVVFETKSGLLRALWHLLLRGERDAVPVAEQPWLREVAREPDPERRLRLNARNSRTVKLRAGALLEVIRGAAAAEPEIAALWQRIEREFYANQRSIVELLDAQGALRAGLDVAAAADILWTLNRPSVYGLLAGARLVARALRGVARERHLLAAVALTGAGAWIGGGRRRCCWR
jgi:AcrR family transcriptional regulator